MLIIERTPGLMALHEAILGVAARARDGLGGDPFGSPYIRDSFTPHLSLAKIDRDDQADAAAIGLQTLARSASHTPERLTCATSVNAAIDGMSWPASPPPASQELKPRPKRSRVRSHRSLRPWFRSALAREARVSWMTADRTGSGRKGAGLVPCRQVPRGHTARRRDRTALVMASSTPPAKMIVPITSTCGGRPSLLAPQIHNG
jgi:hypothetical protein